MRWLAAVPGPFGAAGAFERAELGRSRHGQSVTAGRGEPHATHPAPDECGELSVCREGGREVCGRGRWALGG